MPAFATFYKLTDGKFKRCDLLTLRRGEIIIKHNWPGRYIVHKKLDANTVRCKQITKGRRV